MSNLSPLAKARTALAAAGDDPIKLFGSSAQEQRRTYKRLVGWVHPDRYQIAVGIPQDEFVRKVARQAEAEAMFKQVQDLWRRCEATSLGKWVLTARKHTFELIGSPIKGDMANLYRCTYTGYAEVRTGRLKLARVPANNDLLQREAAFLKAVAKRNSRRSVFVSTLVETFRYRDSSNVERVANVMENLTGYVSLAQVARAYPDGLDVRDLVWIWRRVLLGLTLVHELGYVHGALLPEHIMIHPSRHEVVMVDWCYSTKVGTKVPAMVKGREDFYPPEVTGKASATEATDVYMLAKTMASLYNDRAPQQMISFARGCTTSPQRTRPADAARLLKELTDLIERLYGKRTFRVFPPMPGHP